MDALAPENLMEDPVRRLNDAGLSSFMSLIHELATSDAQVREEVAARLQLEVDEKYRSLALLEQANTSGVSSKQSSGWATMMDITSETLIRCLSDIGMRRVQDPKSEVEDKLGGLTLLLCILHIQDKNATTRRLNCATLLRSVLENKQNNSIDKSYNPELMYLAARVLSQLAAVANTLPEVQNLKKRFVEPAMDWLEDNKYAVRRFAAVLILRALAESAPTLFFEVHSQDQEKFPTSIVKTLMDKEKVEIREGAAEAYGAFLALIHERGREDETFTSALNTIETNLGGKSSAESIHAALLIFIQILKHPGDFMHRANNSKFGQAQYLTYLQRVLQQVGHRDEKIRHTVLELLPMLALFRTDWFMKGDQEQILDVIFEQCKSTTMSDRRRAYIALGDLATAVAGVAGRNIKHPLFALALEAIENGFYEKPFCEEALTSLRMVVGADYRGRELPRNIEQTINKRRFLDGMFNGPVTPNLIRTLEVLYAKIKPVRATIQRNLIAEIQRTLEDYLGTGSAASSSSTAASTAAGSTPYSNGPTRRQSHTEPPAGMFSGLSSRLRKMSTASLEEEQGTPRSVRPSVGGIREKLSRKQAPAEDKHKFMNFITGKKTEYDENRKHDVHTVALALTTLYTFSLANCVDSVLELVVNFLPRLLEDPSPVIRTSASQCVCMVLHRFVAPELDLTMQMLHSDYLKQQPSPPPPPQQQPESPTVVEAAPAPCASNLHQPEQLKAFTQVLDRVIMVGVADSHADIRYTVFSSLTPSADPFILRTKSLGLVYQALDDEAFVVREAVMGVVGRLAHRAPLSVMPIVRKCIAQQMEQLEYSDDVLVKEEAINLLKCLAHGAGSLLEPYVPSMMQHMLRQLHDPSASASVVQATLAAVGELSLVSYAAVEPFLDELLPEIIRALQDRTVLTKTVVAMRALGQIVSSTGDVITPYARYPELADAVLEALRSSERGTTTRMLKLEAVRTAGILGALAPSKLEQMRNGTDIYMLIDEAAWLEGGDSESARKPLIDRRSQQRHQQQLADQQQHYQHQQQVSSSRNRSNTSGAEGYEVQQGPQAQPGPQPAGGEDASGLPEISELLSLDEYYPRISLTALVKLLRSSHEVRNAVQATHHICEHFEPKLLNQYLEFVLNGYIDAIRRKDLEDDNLQLLFEKLSDLISMSEGGVRDHMRKVIDLLREHWDLHLPYCLKVLEALEEVLSVAEFQLHSVQILNLLLRTMKADRITTREKTAMVLATLKKMVSRAPEENVVIIPNQLRLVLPDLLHVVELPQQFQQVRELSLQVVRDIIVRAESLSDFASVLVLPLIRTISRAHTAGDLGYRNATLGVLRKAVKRLGPHYIPYIQVARLQLGDLSKGDKCEAYEKYEEAATAVWNGRYIFETSDCVSVWYRKQWKPAVVTVMHVDGTFDVRVPDGSNLEVIRVDGQLLKPSNRSQFKLKGAESTRKRRQSRKQAQWNDISREWIQTFTKECGEAQKLTTAGDWTEWMRRISIDLLRHSPCPYIQPCATIAEVHEPLAYELFNAAFISVWNYLYYAENKDLNLDQIPVITAMENALKSPQLPAWIRQLLLNLAEFMEMQGEYLPLDIGLLGEQASMSHAYAKCLHHKEMEFKGINRLCVKGKGSAPLGDDEEPPADLEECVEHLISVNNQLGLPEAAVGILDYSGVTHKPLLLEKLDRWEDALDLYTRKKRELEPKRVKFDDLDYEMMSAEDDDDGKKLSPAALKQRDASKRETIRWREELLSVALGEIRCYDALGDFDEVLKQSLEAWDTLVGYGDDPFKLEGEETVYASLENELRRLGASAACSLQQWDKLQNNFLLSDDMLQDVRASPVSSSAVGLSAEDRVAPVSAQSMSTEDRVQAWMYGAMAHLHHHHFEEAHRSIERARECVAPLLTSMLDEHYNRAYVYMVTLQQLAELEEILHFKEKEDEYRRLHTPSVANDLVNKAQRRLKDKWQKRLHCWTQPDVAVWRRILQVRSLVLPPEEDEESWLRLSGMCLRNDNLTLCRNILRRLHASTDLAEGSEQQQQQQTVSIGRASSHNSSSGSLVGGGSPSERAKYALLCYQWESGERGEALDRLARFSESLYESFKGGAAVHTPSSGQGQQAHLLTKALIQLADWKRSVNSDGTSVDDMKEVLRLVDRARECSGMAYKAWHQWALVNHEMVNICSSKQSGVSEEAVLGYVKEAIHGFAHSICLGEREPIASVLQDTLRLLTLWFTYGDKEEVCDAVAEGLKRIRPEVWLEVIPQLIARIDHPSPYVTRLLSKLLIDVARIHPQALIYPITVTSNTASHARQTVAAEIIQELQVSNPRLVQEATLVSREMMDVAITWHELWYQGLEDAANLYFTDGDVPGMMLKLDELHDHWASRVNYQGTGEIKPESQSTIRTVSFIHAFSRDLQEAHEWMDRYKETNQVIYLNQAWDLYSQLFRRIKRQINNVDSLELQHVSPKLLHARNFQLAVPGTYREGGEIVRISHFSTTVKVITSKQRPRHMTIFGSDGNSYSFLLKGHEDLRQDERVMQLFRLINALLDYSPETSRSDLSIKRYSVMPLSGNSGVLGWVPDCDTLQKLIKDYRESRNIPLDLEKRLVWGISVDPGEGGFNERPARLDYDQLTVMQKTQIFGEALEKTQGEDLSRMLWLRSQSSEVWLGRRTNYTRSLAVMCMAGYILGLGDRHPSNLMIERNSGRIVHIDFGDCFEVAMERNKYPEKVPFRLTRMLVHAMEVSGIEGTFRSTCTNVMKVLRENRDSLMAMLEAFVHDPVIGWKLMNADEAKAQKSSGRTNEESGNPEEKVETEVMPATEEKLNDQAVKITRRIQMKLNGTDFASKDGKPIEVGQQVDKLIQAAQSHENLSQMFVGWCAFW